MKSELIFVRHGETESNSRGLLHGRTDIPLAPSGRHQATMVARRIAEIGNIDSIISSPLERARSTAAEIGRTTGIAPAIEPKLTEFDFGDLEGLTFDDLQVNHPELYLSMIDPDGFDHRFPNGESRSALHERVVAALHRIKLNETGGPVVVVAHLIVIATAVAHLTSGDPHDVIRYLVRNCSVTHLEIDGKAGASIRCLDDVSHLGPSEK
ncbi:MAG: histidine phosphatase family protein [Thermomicrobiaceae bacterium]